MQNLRFLMVAAVVTSVAAFAPAALPRRQVTLSARGMPVRWMAAEDTEVAPEAAPATEQDEAWTPTAAAAEQAKAAVEEVDDTGLAKKARIIFYGVISLVPFLLFVPFFLPRSMVPTDMIPPMDM